MLEEAMADYDDAERHAIHEVEPEDQGCQDAICIKE
jgi:hypothetical protein